MENIALLLSGGVFGFVLDKAKTNVPLVISDQMRMSNFTMMRMFLAAAATSSAVVLALDIMGLKERKPKAVTALGFGKMGGFGANVLGGVLLGMGMFFTGSCPGTIWAQLPVELAYTGYVVCGGILGTILYGYADKIMHDSVPQYHSKKTLEKSDITPDRMSYRMAAGMFISICSLAIYLLNLAFPWQDQVSQVVVSRFQYDSANPLDPTATVWDPAVAGLLLGLLQIPVQLSSAGSLGQSSGWVLVSSYIAGIFDRNLDKNAPYLKDAQAGIVGFKQLLLSVGILGGAVLSQNLGGYPTLSTVAHDGSGNEFYAFFGGVLLLFGARLGCGCTSGHGLSGLGALSLGSLVSVVGIFAGGMGAALLFP